MNTKRKEPGVTIAAWRPCDRTADQNWTGREFLNWHFNPGPAIPYDRLRHALKGR